MYECVCECIHVCVEVVQRKTPPPTNRKTVTHLKKRGQRKKQKSLGYSFIRSIH